MWERMAQLKLAPDLAAISRHRMCDGDVEAERKAMFEIVLPGMEKAGWNVKLAFLRFWEGERDREKLLQGLNDSSDRTLVKHVYDKYFAPLIKRKLGGVEEQVESFYKGVSCVKKSVPWWISHTTVLWR